METPLYRELESRIRRALAAPHSVNDVSCWLGYLAALIEWDLITSEEHRHLSSLLPPVEPDPSLKILLGIPD